MLDALLMAGFALAICLASFLGFGLFLVALLWLTTRGMKDDEIVLGKGSWE